MGKGSGEHNMNYYMKDPAQVYLRVRGRSQKVYVSAGSLKSAYKQGWTRWPGKIYKVVDIDDAGAIIWKDCTEDFFDAEGNPKW